MTQKIAVLSLTVLASAAVLAERFVTASGAYAAAGEPALGVSTDPAAIGEHFTADVLGTSIATAGEAIAVDDEIEVGVSGVAMVADAGVVVGRALQAADGPGSRFEVFLIPNHKPAPVA